MKIINLSRVGIPKKTFLENIFFCPKFASKVSPKVSHKVAPKVDPKVSSKVAPKVASKVAPKSSNKAVSMIPPKAVPKAVSSKFLTKQPSSVPTSHLVVSLSLYIFGIVCS